MNIWLEEYVLFGFVVVAVPALNYALERVYKKRILSRWLILLIYFLIFYVFFEINERLHRNEGQWEPPEFKDSLEMTSE